MQIRFLRKAHRLASAACALALAAGCAESTYVWTLNPGGSGKVEVEARLQPPIKPFDGKRDPFKGEPDALAKDAARDILKKSEGVAAWTDVSSGIADDGRLLFRGTAYFSDLTKVKIEGDPFPLSILKPSLADEGGGRFVVGLQIGDVSKDVPGAEEIETRARESLAAATPDEAARALTKAKVAYQAAKPILTAFLSTMRTETIVRAPGEAVEASNFRVREDGTLALAFDGPRLLAAIDDLAARDAAGWQKVVAAYGDEDDPEEEFRWRLNELIFGERGPVRAVVEGDGKPRFDYARELAGVVDARGEILAGSPPGREPDRFVRSDGGGGYWKLSGGPLASARTDLGTGTGWTGVLGGGGGDESLGLGVQVEVSRVEYENSDGVRQELHRATVGAGGRFGPAVLGGGLAFSFGPGDIWATGPQLTCGIGVFGRHAELYLAASGYVWIGERDDEFDLDLEGDVRLVAGFRF